MLNISLFLGIPLIPLYADALESISPKVKEMFISDKEDSYLKEVIFEQNRYLGKYLNDSITISQLLLLEENIYSILNKMLPEVDFNQTALVIFTIQNKTT